MKKIKTQISKYKKQNTKKGITLISLIITIVIMLILAGVTINVTIDGGIFGHAKNAKDSVEIAEEREIIQNAAIYALQEGKIDKENLLEKLKNKFGEGNVVTYNNGDGSVIVKIADKNRVYEVDKKGNIKEVSMDIFMADSTPGVLDGAGSVSDPYIIMSIEDLVEMSTGAINFNNKYVKLGRNLDFEAELSYENYDSREYNEFLGITDDVGLLEALTNEKYNGFTPITFAGNAGTTFDGDNKVIKNIYMKGEGNLGFFLKMNIFTTVKNLEITGKIISTGDNVGGISAQYGIIENCISRVNITSTGNNVGGIVGTNATCTNCKNYGQINGVNRIGGISGYNCSIYSSENYGFIRASSNAGGIVGGIQTREIIGCKNFANIIADSDAGGIVGYNHTSYVINCFNSGNIEASVDSSGGIVGGECNLKAIINCYNSGNITGNKYVGGIIGSVTWTQQELSPIENCYTTGNITGNTNVAGIIGRKSGYGTHIITNCYWPEEVNLECGTKTGSDILNITDSVAKPKAEMKTAEFLKLLNDYVNAYNTANANNTDFVELNNWIFDNKTGYPVLEE